MCVSVYVCAAVGGKWRASFNLRMTGGVCHLTHSSSMVWSCEDRTEGMGSDARSPAVVVFENVDGLTSTVKYFKHGIATSTPGVGLVVYPANPQIRFFSAGSLLGAGDKMYIQSTHPEDRRKNSKLLLQLGPSIGRLNKPNREDKGHRFDVPFEYGPTRCCRLFYAQKYHGVLRVFIPSNPKAKIPMFYVAYDKSNGFHTAPLEGGQLSNKRPPGIALVAAAPDPKSVGLRVRAASLSSIDWPPPPNVLGLVVEEQGLSVGGASDAAILEEKLLGRGEIQLSAMCHKTDRRTKIGGHVNLPRMLVGTRIRLASACEHLQKLRRSPNEVAASIKHAGIRAVVFDTFSILSRDGLELHEATAIINSLGDNGVRTFVISATTESGSPILAHPSFSFDEKKTDVFRERCTISERDEKGLNKFLEVVHAAEGRHLVYEVAQKVWRVLSTVDNSELLFFTKDKAFYSQALDIGATVLLQPPGNRFDVGQMSRP